MSQEAAPETPVAATLAPPAPASDAPVTADAVTVVFDRDPAPAAAKVLTPPLPSDDSLKVKLDIPADAEKTGVDSAFNGKRQLICVVADLSSDGSGEQELQEKLKCIMSALESKLKKRRQEPSKDANKAATQ